RTDVGYNGGLGTNYTFASTSSASQQFNNGQSRSLGSLAANSLLGRFQLPNPAPDVNLEEPAELYAGPSLPGPQLPTPSSSSLDPSASATASSATSPSQLSMDIYSDTHRKKKYAKEAWPGRKPSLMPI